MKRVKQFLQIAIGSTIGVYLGRALWLWQDYNARPGLYEMTSFPWYTPLLFGALIAAGMLLIEGLALFFVNRRLKKGKQGNDEGGEERS